MQRRIYIKHENWKAYVPCEENGKKSDRGSLHVHEQIESFLHFFAAAKYVNLEHSRIPFYQRQRA